MGNYSTKTEDSKQKPSVFWFDRRNSETTKTISKRLQKQLTNAQSLFDFIPAHDIRTIKEGNDTHIPIIALCLLTTDRFSSVLDFGLEGLEGTDYDRTLVIVIHPADKDEVTVSTKMKAELTHNYKDLKNVIDVKFSQGSFRGSIEGYYGQNVNAEVDRFLKNKYQSVYEASRRCVLS